MWRVDGEPRACVAPDDRGLAYGDGVFETVAVVAGQPALWPAHRRRLERGCERLGFAPPARAVLDREVEAFAGGADGVIKLIVTRGSGGRGYQPPMTPQPRVLAHRTSLPTRPPHWWQSGVRVIACRTCLADQPALAGIKHLNRLEQVVARTEWRDSEIAEGLMADAVGRVVEGTVTNLFARFGRELRTPPLMRQGVAGIMRRRVIAEAGALGLTPRVGAISWGELENADELWLTNSLVGLWPVRAFGDRRWRGFEYGHRMLSLMVKRQWVAVPV